MLRHVAQLFRLNHEPSIFAGKKTLLHSRKTFYTTALSTSSTTRQRQKRAREQDTTMPEIFDDKSEHCIPFLLGRVKAHQARYGASDAKDAPPLFLGLNGVQGAGKTVLVCMPMEYVCCIMSCDG